MAIKRQDLDSDLKLFLDNNGKPVKVELEEIANALFAEQETALAAGETAERVKKFFDFFPLHVFLPWLNALVDVVIENKAATESDVKSLQNAIKTAKKDLENIIDNVFEVANAANDLVNTVDSGLEAHKGNYEEMKLEFNANLAKKVNASDIADNLNTNNSLKVLSAAQGVELKRLIEEAENVFNQAIESVVRRLNALADSDDVTLDQFSEIVAYIKNNKGLIDAITTSKLGASDIADNLNTNNASKVLSAAQGVVLKGLIDAVQKEIEEKIVGVFPVNVVENGEKITADKKLAEIEAANEEGRCVCCYFIRGDGVLFVLHLRGLVNIGGTKAASFSCCDENGILVLNLTANGITKSIIPIDHDKLTNRDLPDQHPISSITGLEDALANIPGKPAETTEVIVDNEDGSLSTQSFIYTLPSDDTVITVDGWGYPDRVLMNYRVEESGTYGDEYSVASSSTNSITLPADLPSEAVSHWKKGMTFEMRYNSDIITKAVATYSAGGGNVDLSNYYNKDETKSEIDAAIAEALANAGGGSGKEWRKIRTVTIPEDITTDTSGVSFYPQTNGGSNFSFDTDEDGKPFDLDEIYIYYQAGSHQTTGSNGAYLNKEYRVYNHGIMLTDLRVQGDANGFSTGWAKYENCGGRGYQFGVNLQQATSFSSVANSGIHFNAISLSNGTVNYGFKAGSKFEFYGR